MRPPALVSALLLGVLAASPAALGDVSISYDHKVCQVGQDCVIDVWVHSSEALGKLNVFLHYDNTKLTVQSLENGGYLPTGAPGTLENVPNAAAYSPTVCAAQATCGFIHYYGIDATDSTLGSGRLLRVTLRATQTTQLDWHVCSCLCNASICVAYPFATTYDGLTQYSFSWSGAAIDVSGTAPPDSDGDCIPDYVEIDRGTDPFDRDSDDDGIDDGTCPPPGLSGFLPGAVSDPLSGDGEDLDNDARMSDGETDPADADSDDDGLFDGTECGLAAPQSAGTDLGAGRFVPDADPASRTDPRDADSDDDGAPDGWEDTNRNGAWEPGSGESDPGDGASTPPPAVLKAGARVLLLGDGEADGQVGPALEALGHVVTDVPYHYDWDGADPDADDFDVIVLLDGYDYGYDLETSANERLGRFVHGGCGLVATEWTAYDVCDGSKTGALAELLPVVSPDNDYGSGLERSVVFSHPLTEGLPGAWTSDSYATFVEAVPGALVLAEVGGHPAITYGTMSGGTVVHVNHDMTYSLDTIEPETLAALGNAVAFASCDKVFVDGFETGDVIDWSAAVP